MEGRVHSRASTPGWKRPGERLDNERTGFIGADMGVPRELQTDQLRSRRVNCA
jgi:hypothetical protein